MIVSLKVHHHLGSESYWQLTRCHLLITSVAAEVGSPALYRAIHFGTLEQTIRYAKGLTFTYLMNRQFKEMPDHMEWRVTEDDQWSPVLHVSTRCIGRQNWAVRGQAWI